MTSKYNYDYEIPEFLTRQSADEIHARMLNNLPSGIDKSEGNIPWDFTRPSALEKAEMVEFTLNETIKLIFPQWSYGRWLDLHGEKVNVFRREANPASGSLDITGAVGTVIPGGFRFATAADLSSSVIFETLESVKLSGDADENGYVTNSVEIRAVEGGLIGNVDKDTIKLMASPLKKIAWVSNPEPMSGGAEAETDEDFLVRILDAMRNGSSMVGCSADYIRWAKEVAAVGKVIVDPEWNDPELPESFHYTDPNGNKRCAGAVRLIIVDANGMPANKQILDAVYSHIAGNGDADTERLMPIGARLTVIAPDNVGINVSAKVVLADGQSIDAVIERFKKSLTDYWLNVAQEATDDEITHTGYVRLTRVGAVLAQTDGVVDYSLLTVNGKTDNIPVTNAQFPVTNEVILNAGN